MAHTKKEATLLNAITLAVFKNKWDKRAFVKENVMARARALENLYKSSPQKLINMTDLYYEKLTSDEVSDACIDVIQLYLEMRAAELNS